MYVRMCVCVFMYFIFEYILYVCMYVCMYVHYMYMYECMQGARCNSIVEHPLMVLWLIGSIPHGGLIEPFLILTSVFTTRVTKAVVCPMPYNH